MGSELIRLRGGPLDGNALTLVVAVDRVVIPLPCDGGFAAGIERHVYRRSSAAADIFEHQRAA